MRDSTFLIESSDYICPTCKKGHLLYRDHCKRILRHEGGSSEWLWIPRCKCDDPGCRKLHRMLPDLLVRFKQYSAEVISGVLDESLDPAKRLQIRKEVAEKSGVTTRSLYRYEAAYRAGGFAGLKPNAAPRRDS